MADIFNYYGVRGITPIDINTWEWQSKGTDPHKHVYPFARVALNSYNWVTTLGIDEDGCIVTSRCSNDSYSYIDPEDVEWLKKNLNEDYDKYVDMLRHKLAELESEFVIANNYDWDDEEKTPKMRYKRLIDRLHPTHYEPDDDRGEYSEKEYWL